MADRMMSEEQIAELKQVFEWEDIGNVRNI